MGPGGHEVQLDCVGVLWVGIVLLNEVVVVHEDDFSVLIFFLSSISLGIVRDVIQEGSLGIKIKLKTQTQTQIHR
jgi:hypothetical protein